MTDPHDALGEIERLNHELANTRSELEFSNAILEGRDLKGPAGRGCPQCKTCGRDGHEGAVAREAALRLVRNAEREKDIVQAICDRLLQDIEDLSKDEANYRKALDATRQIAHAALGEDST